VVDHIRQRSFRRGRLSEQVVAELERMIADQYAQPGSLLPKEAELVERFQVSRVVIREAMKILEERGAVEVRAGRGTRTVAMSPERVKSSLMRLFAEQPRPTARELEYLLEIRQVLEETAAGLAAVRAGVENLAEMERALSGMRGQDPGCTAEEADLRFHRAVARATQNSYFELVLEPLTEVFLRQIRLTASFSLGIELHQAIFDEIAQGNPVGARQATRRLMKFTREDSLRALSLLEEQRAAQAPPGDS
jgi:DNA-binding FadR family transcriptional regulator